EETVAIPEGHVATGMWRHGAPPETAFAKGALTHLTHHGPATWMSMMGWLAAVDEYSPTHYDPDFAAAHRYGDGRSIVAGPQLAAKMVAGLEGSLGPRWWIRSYQNVQRRPVYPNEVLTSFSYVHDVTPDGATVKLWLVDDAGVVKGAGTAHVEPARDERGIGQ